MRYYDADAGLERIRDIITGEIRSGINLLTASYLVRKHNLPPNSVQKVLTDLVSVGDLEIRYWVLCSGEHQNFDLDREFSNKRDIPTHPIPCSKCGDLYTPEEEHILISFEPTSSFKNYLQQAS